MKTTTSLLSFLLPMIVLIFSITSCQKTGCEEQLIDDCLCNDIYVPVCGCNGKTYDNACRAMCYNISEYTEGKCE